MHGTATGGEVAWVLELARLAFRTRDDGRVLFELEDVAAARAVRRLRGPAGRAG